MTSVKAALCSLIFSLRRKDVLPMTKLPPLSQRLKSALAYINKGDIIADIGTDHAYLPIHLVLTGTCTRAHACDVNEGPCIRARENAARYGVADKIEISRRDGLEGLTDSEINKFVIFGMGGELIASILERASVRDGVEFVLNPMTKQEKLRSFLSENGFTILDETIVFSDSKYYQIIYAKKNGKGESLTPAELKFGKINIEKRSPLFIEYAKKTRDELLRAHKMREESGAVKSDDDALLYETEQILKS